MKKVIIIGASSGIGRELAKIYAKEGCRLGLAARRLELLNELRHELDADVFTMQMDVSKTEEAPVKLDELIRQMGGMDLIILCAGTGFLNPDLKWELEEATIEVNVKGFTALADTAFSYFTQQKSGQLAGISSIAALRGSAICPAYNASKAYISNYMEGLRCKSKKQKTDIIVTDIQPGLVDTAMAQGEGLFWVAPPEVAARQIASIISHRKKHGYVTKRWRIIAYLFKILPGWIYERLPG